ncbi:MAG: hypothetical protein ACOYOU_08465 [Kiritimatiellia bacterium]
MTQCICRRRPIVWFLTLGCMLAQGATSPAMPPEAATVRTNTPPDLAREMRVYYVRPRVFEYLFTGAGTGASSNSTPLLFFRDLGGNTPAVRIFEPLGAYTVTGFTPRKARVFKDTIHAFVDEDTSTVTIRDNTGSNRVLTVGKPLTEPGLMACLVSTNSGGWGHVRAGDALEIEDVDVTITGITTTSATLRANTQDVSVPLATDAERKAVMALWETRRREAEEQQARARALAEEKRLAATIAAEVDAASVPAATWPPPRPASTAPLTTGTSMQGVFFGTEVHYPTVFEVVPYTYIYPDGHLYSQGFRAPSCFEYRPRRHDRRWR